MEEALKKIYKFRIDNKGVIKTLITIGEKQIEGELKEFYDFKGTFSFYIYSNGEPVYIINSFSLYIFQLNIKLIAVDKNENNKILILRNIDTIDKFLKY
jgi:hypothetical protein